MKRKKNKSSLTLAEFLHPLLGERTDQAVRKLNAYRVETVKQLAGLVQVSVTKFSRKEARQRGISAAFVDLQRGRTPDAPVRRLGKLLHISPEFARRIARACEGIPEDYQRYYFDSGWALGAVKRSQKSGARVLSAAPSHSFASGFFVIPRYKDAGKVYDQGNRGTCVANAICTLLDYKSDRSSSRQFLYHQCKMVDGMMHLDGTTIEAPFRVLSDKALVDWGNVNEAIWPYNPRPTRTEHQGPPPEKAFSTERVLADEKPLFIGPDDKVNAINSTLTD